MKSFFFFLTFFCAVQAFGQSGPAKRALKALAENDLEKAREQILKALEKDSADALLHYDIARLQVLLANREGVDSANHSERRSRYFFEAIPAEDLDKMNKAGLTLLSLDLIRREIDSLAFQLAGEEQSEESFNYFLTNYPEAAQRDLAIAKRDSLAYSYARTTNTYQSYRDFMDKYPTAPQIALASERYERLFYEEETASGSLESYESFLRKNPETPYRPEVEEIIFRKSAVVPQQEILAGLLRRFSGRPVANEIRNFMYYLFKERESRSFWNDSLRSINAINNEVWVPTYEKEQVVFVDESSEPKFSIENEALSEFYKCSVLEAEVIIGIDQIYSRTGDLVYEGRFDHADPAFPGYILLERNGRNGLITTWGRQILPIAFEEIDVLPTGMIRARDSRGWRLFTFTGIEITDNGFGEIQSFRNFQILQKNDRIGILPNSVIRESIASENAANIDYYDDFEWLSDDQLWVRRGDEEMLLDENLEVLIPMDIQRIEPLTYGFILRRPAETILYNTSVNQRYSTNEKLLSFNDQYVRLTSVTNEGLFDLEAFRFVALPDSARLVGRYSAVVFSKGSFSVYQHGKEMARFEEELPRMELLSREKTEWILFPGKRNSRIITSAGAVRFPSYDDVTLLTDSLFILGRSGKKSLVSYDGKEILAPVYDAMGNFDGSDLSLLRNGKFGLYRPSENLLIKPSYDKTLQTYGQFYFIGTKNGKKGLIDKADKVVVPFSYDDILYWNDTLALINESGKYSFHQIGGEILPDISLKSLTFLRNDPDEIIVMGFNEGFFGVYSNMNGTILPAEFDDIVNLGSPEHPVYFTETFVKQADLHIVVYYDEKGNILKKQAMEPGFFSEIYCDQ